jgi:NADPH:quinone reductase-like Zn-dependent oxidoreductase
MNPEVTREFWIMAPGQSAVLERPLPGGAPGEVLVQTLFSGISRGTESLVFRGEVPASQWESMRAPFQKGDFSGWVHYGYMNVGRVVAPADHPLMGRTVFSLSPHRTFAWLPEGALTPLPPEVPAGRALLAANLETAVNALWDGVPGVGDRILVVGGGVVGMLIAWLCRSIPGVELLLVDPEETREPVARALGIPYSSSPPEGAFDLVFHASGHPSGAAVALAAAGVEATVVEVSWFGAHAVPLPLGEGFHSRRLTLRSSQVGRIPPVRAPRWDFRRRSGVVMRLLADPALDALITGESDFEELPEVMTVLSGGAGRTDHSGRLQSSSTLCHRIRYPENA